MKKTILALVGIVVALSAMAQKHEFFASFNAMPYVIESKGLAYYNKGISENYSNTKFKYGFGGVNLGYLNNIYSDFSIGLSYSYFRTRREYVDAMSLIREASYHSFMILARRRWKELYDGKLTLYSQLGAGIQIRAGESYKSFVGSYLREAYFTESAKRTRLAYHISIVGADYKLTPKWSVFGEAGFGYMGILNFGVKYSLND